MSALASTALRIAARMALEGATYAGDQVFDSHIDPINKLSAASAQPFIVVSSEDEESHPKGMDITSGQRQIDLVIEIAVAQAVGVGDAAEIVIPASDGGFEISLALITRQAMRAIFEGGEWSDLFKAFCMTIKETTTRRGTGSDKGARFAARQIVLTLCPIDEPAFGYVPGDNCPWARLITSMDDHSDLAALAPVFSHVITGDEVPDWDKARAALGLTHGAAGRVGLGALSGVGEAPAILTEGNPDDDGT